MKKISLILVLATSLFANYYNLKPVEVTKDISCVIGALNGPDEKNNGLISNVCYVNMGDSIVVLDSGPTYNFAKELHSLIKKEHPNKKISHVILSNYHDDRTLGASYFKKIGAKVVGHKSINNDMDKYKSKFDRMFTSLPKEVLEGTKITKADVLVEHNDIIKGSNKNLKILKLSDKSQDFSDIAILSEDDSFIFAGNLVFNGRLLTYFEKSDIDGWIEALEKLANYKAKHVLGGHGGKSDTNSYMTSLEYLKKIKKDVALAYEDDVDLEEIASHVDTSKFSHLENFKALNGKNLYNLYMQLELAE